MPDHISANFHRDGYRFVPLVCEDFSLLCSLDILFATRLRVVFDSLPVKTSKEKSVWGTHFRAGSPSERGPSH